jgi:hypothetical protein
MKRKTEAVVMLSTTNYSRAVRSRQLVLTKRVRVVGKGFQTKSREEIEERPPIIDRTRIYQVIIVKIR